MSAKETQPLDQVRLQQRMQDGAVMAGRMAHAFDNVLTGILGFAELTLSQLPPGSTPYRYLAEVLQAAQLGTQLTQQLHTFGRCGVARPGSTSLAVVVGDEEARLRSVAPGVSLQVTVPAGMPPVAIDVETLRLVLSHLFDNAREALPNAGSVTLSASLIELTAADGAAYLGHLAPGPHIAVTVMDTGCGLSPDVRRRLFVEPFFTTKPRHQGLGLAVVYRILNANRGGLRIEPNPAGGTVVHLLLPTAAAVPA